jgi:hypothetical protein
MKILDGHVTRKFCGMELVVVKFKGTIPFFCEGTEEYCDKRLVTRPNFQLETSGIQNTDTERTWSWREFSTSPSTLCISVLFAACFKLMASHTIVFVCVCVC